MGQTLTATLESATQENTTPSRAHLFQPGNDPRRKTTPIPKGTILKKTLTERELFRERVRERVEPIADEMVGLVKSYRDLEDPCPECKRTPCGTCGRGVPADPCPMCGRGMLRSEDTRLRAMEGILDRVGVPRQTKVEMTATVDVHSVTFIKHLTDEELHQIQSLIDLAQDRALQAGEISADELPPEEEEPL